MRTVRVAWTLVGVGIVAVVLVAVVSTRSGAPADPYEALRVAAVAALDPPVAADVELDLDLGRLGEVSRSTDPDLSFALGLLAGSLVLDGRVTVGTDAALLELAGRDGVDVLGLRLDDGAAPLVRVDPDGLPIPVPTTLLRRALPGLTGDWVAVPGGSRLAPDLARPTAALADIRAALVAADRDEVAARVTLTHVGDDEDGARFRVTSAETGGDGALPVPEDGPVAPVPTDDGSGGAAPEALDAPGADVWLLDGRITRVRLDVLPFLRTDVGSFRLRGGDGGLLVDLRPVTADLPPRPEPSGVLDPTVLERFLPGR